MTHPLLPSQNEVFVRTLEHLQGSSTESLHNTSVMSGPKRTLDQLLRTDFGFSKDTQLSRDPTFERVVIKRTPENLQGAREQWTQFVDTFFTQKNRPVPDWPVYVQAQQELGIQGDRDIDRLGRSVKRSLQMRLAVLLEPLSVKVPRWSWVSRAHCYFVAAHWKNYTLPSGGFAC